MKLKHIIPTSTVLLCIVTSSVAESALEREHKQLQEQRDKALVAATDPINRRYKELIEQLMRRAIQSNDLSVAVQLKEELDSMDPHALGWKFRGRWVKANNKKELVEFTTGGNFQEKWEGHVDEGRWKATSETEAKIALKKGANHVYRLSEDGKSVKRLADGSSWVREDKD